MAINISIPLILFLNTDTVLSYLTFIKSLDMVAMYGVMLMNESKYIPEFCMWELTIKCNMRCKHCGSMAGQARKNELTVEECFDVAE